MQAASQTAVQSVTRWFAFKDDKPVRDGVYQVTFSPRSSLVKYARWANGAWSTAFPTAQEAAHAETHAGVSQPNWRGLTQE